MSSTENTRCHRAGDNPAGRPARDLVDRYWATGGPVIAPAATA